MTKATCVRISLIAAGIFPILVAGCPQNAGPAGGTGEAKLVAFSSSQELLDYFRGQARAQTQSRSWGMPDFFGFGGMAPAAGAEDSADTGNGGTGGTSDEQSFTTTNLQEVGVDESDVIKSDGTYFYIARGDTLRVVQATPIGELAEVGRLNLDVRVSEMYLFGTKLILLAQRYEVGGGGWGMPAMEMEMWPPYFVGSDLTVVEVDVSNPRTPAQLKEIELDGSLVSSRLVNGRLILVLTIAPQLPENPTPARINAMPLEEILPQVRDQVRAREMVTWQNCLHPESPDGYFMTGVVTLDAADIETIVHSVAVIGNAGTIYASTAALYLTDAEYDPDDNYREMAAIHKFAFDAEGAARYVASGSVPGRLLNQFSLGEFEGHLRVATHVSNPVFFGMFEEPVSVGVATAAQDIEPPSDFNAVYVLKQSGSELEVTGSIENIAPNEEIHSARFIGDHGFLVTFRQIDPLFVLDLSDPTDPQVVGELKIPGFSDYLHPWGEDRLIGVGKASVPTDEGFDWFQGVQLSLFDVSDWSNPTAIQQITLGGRGSSSEVDYTHKGFTFREDDGLLAIPMRLYSVEQIPWEYGELAFDGVVALRVDAETGFTELGRLDAVRDSTYGDYWYGGPENWTRAALIGDNLYALTADGAAAAALDDLSSATVLEFEE